MVFQVVPKLCYDSYKDYRRELKAVKAKESVMPKSAGGQDEHGE